ncbi:MAG TPA: helix-turn-helix transcriptional regulator [Blastocatellia bacterium]|nr:helix-turn-helix transcriptional regulator [Blastocatellia bacterium]
MKTDGLIKLTELGHYLRRKRERDGLSLRDAARETKISAATLSRIENESGIPDSATLAKLANWLNIPLDRIIGGSSSGDQVIVRKGESTPDVVEVHLRADKNLTPETAKALADMFRLAYTQFSKTKR